jgi:hypothetical protein
MVGDHAGSRGFSFLGTCACDLQFVHPSAPFGGRSWPFPTPAVLPFLAGVAAEAQTAHPVTPFILSLCRALTCSYILTYLYLPDRLSVLPDSAWSLPLSRYLAALLHYVSFVLTFLFSLMFSCFHCLCYERTTRSCGSYSWVSYRLSFDVRV